jgi:hypothetical protein
VCGDRTWISAERDGILDLELVSLHGLGEAVVVNETVFFFFKSQGQMLATQEAEIRKIMV